MRNTNTVEQQLEGKMVRPKRSRDERKKVIMWRLRPTLFKDP
jgi:hypothetical protein